LPIVSPERVVEFGQWLCETIVKAVPHRHLVMGIPKILRRYFQYDRKLLSELSRCGWESLKAYFRLVSRDSTAVPGAAVAIQTFGDFLGINPHLHVLISDGVFHESGMLTVAPAIDTRTLERLFRHHVLALLLKKGKITQDMIALLDRWRHSGFNIYCGSRILPWQKTSMENLARYIIRATFSQERMTYVPEAGSVIYQSKNGQSSRVFDTLEWLAAMTSHIPNKGEQMVRYYGYYSNASRGQRKKAGIQEIIPYLLQPETTDVQLRKTGSRLIQKIYEVDPLTCPKCQGKMRVIAFIEDPDVVKKILQYLNLWEFKQPPRPVAHAPPMIESPAYDDIPQTTAEDFIVDPVYPFETYF